MIAMVKTEMHRIYGGHMIGSMGQKLNPLFFYVKIIASVREAAKKSPFFSGHVH